MPVIPRHTMHLAKRDDVTTDKRWIAIGSLSGILLFYVIATIVVVTKCIAKHRAKKEFMKKNSGLNTVSPPLSGPGVAVPAMRRAPVAVANNISERPVPVATNIRRKPLAPLEPRIPRKPLPNQVGARPPPPPPPRKGLCFRRLI